MKYIDEYRRSGPVQKVARRIRDIVPQHRIKIMEVCGTHTQSFFRFGLDKLLPGQLEFIAGPGCPVCVSSQEYIDRAIAYAERPDVTVLTFGDMVRVPGTVSNLQLQRAAGSKVLVVYSALDALAYARQHPDQTVIFLAVGFETTACTIAQTVLLAQKEKLRNLFFLSSLKTIPSAMQALLEDKRLKISAFLCPGHVSAIIGTKPYEFIPRRYKIGCCVAGFEPLDILEGIYLLLRQMARRVPTVENQYRRVVTRGGNVFAQKSIRAVFTETDAVWRGLGMVPASALTLRPRLSRFDAEKALPLRFKRYAPDIRQGLCRCPDVIKGMIRPDECRLFITRCSPENPYGPCMVSSEGACSTYYKYHSYGTKNRQ